MVTWMDDRCSLSQYISIVVDIVQRIFVILIYLQKTRTFDGRDDFFTTWELTQTDLAD